MNWMVTICSLLLFVTWIILMSLSIKGVRFASLQIIVPWVFLIFDVSSLTMCLLCVSLMIVNLIYLCIYHEVNSNNKKVNKNGGKRK